MIVGHVHIFGGKRMKIEIVVAYNTQVDMTKEFLDVMYKTTRYSKHQIGCILVHGYVEDEEDINHKFVTKFIKVKNEGFCKTLNAGLREVSEDTDYIFFVGNDSFPRERGWLDTLVQIAQQEEVPIVCPADQVSCKSPPRPPKLSRGSLLIYDFYPSIAWLMKRELLDKVGYLDERLTGAGYYADNDYCRRVCLHYGSNCIILTKDVVLDHKLSVEGKSMKITNQMNMNRKQYEEILNE